MKASQIKPNPDNPRIIKDDKFQKLVQSLKEFPEMAVVRPVVINEDNIILGGNMRYKAMIEAGWKDIPVTQVKGWTKEQELEFIIKDNFLGSGSTLIACEQTERICYGMDLDPRYVDVIRKRYAKYTNNGTLPENWEELTPVVE